MLVPKKDVVVHPFRDLSCIVPLLPATIYTYTVNHETGVSSFPYVSDYVEKMFHIPAKDIEADPATFLNLVHKDDVDIFTNTVLVSMKNLTPWDHQMRMLIKDGSIIHVHGKSLPHKVEEKNADGTVTNLTVWHGVLNDITEKKKNEDAAKASLKGLLENSTGPLFAVDCDGFITEWNDPMGDITGYDREAVVNKIFTSFAAENNKHAVESMFSTSLRTGNKYSHDVTLLSKDGQEIYVHVTYKRIKDANGTAIGVHGCCQDITKEKEAEKEKNAALKLADAEKSLTEWLSHEIRNPLSVAMEAAQALKDQQSKLVPTCLVDDEGSSYVELICRSIVYVVDVLTNMLDLNKCFEGKIILHPELCSIREDILIPTQQMMGIWSNSGKIPIRVLGNEEVLLYVDKLRLKQVITNLLSNAIKYTIEGFINLSVETQEGLGDNDDEKSVIITVSDSGCGVNEKEYDNLFSKWEQLGSSINGAGIGLCLCRMLVKNMGGKIDLNKEYHSGVENYPGAQFTVTLPSTMLAENNQKSVRKRSCDYAFSALSEAVVASSKVMKKVKTPISDKTKLFSHDVCVRGKFRLLIVDDDRIGRRLLRCRFSRIFPDAIIEEVESGEKAIEKTGTNGVIYDIISMDHFMDINEMNGGETIRELRRLNVDSLIIGISGNSKENEHVSAGADFFFQKPIPSDEILLQGLISILPPPAGWNALIVDDVKLNNHFLARKLHIASSTHFTNLEVAKKRWSISACTSAIDAMDILKTKFIDLVVLDQNLGDDAISGTDIALFAKENSVNEDIIIVLNTGSELKRQEGELPFDLCWPKPLPSVEQMRRSLTGRLIKSKETAKESREKI